MLNAYMGWGEDIGPEEGAVLIFAKTAREAKRVGYPVLKGFFVLEFRSVRVKRLREPHLLELADKKKLDGQEPHVIDDPPVCPRCEQWGKPIRDGACDFCRERD